MRQGRHRCAIAIVSVASLLAASAALAGSDPDPNTDDFDYGTSGGLRYRSDVEAFNMGYARAVAGCGSEEFNTIGGGVRLAGPSAADHRIASTVPYDWYDLDDEAEDGWLASGLGATPGNVLTFSICASGATPNYHRYDVPNSSGPVRSAKRACGSGNGRVTGGGGRIATSGSFLSQSYPFDGNDGDKRPDDGWAIRVYDTAGGPGGMNVNAVCRAGPVSYTSAKDNVAPHHSAASLADCPAGTHVTGGGAKLAGPAGKVHLASSYPFDDGDGNLTPDDGWKTGGYNGSTRKRGLTVYAICLG